MQNMKRHIPGVSHAALLRSHVQILELMAAHCDRLLQQESGSAFHKIELRRAAAAYRQLAQKHRRFLEAVDLVPELEKQMAAA
jgi:hypothetical protein